MTTSSGRRPADSAPGTVQYYRYAWDQSPTHEWTGLEPQWSSGTITTPPTAAGTWYLHVQGYNGQNVPNGTYDYDINIGGVGVAADLDCDGDVDQADFARFDLCVSGPGIPYTGDCGQGFQPGRRRGSG